MATDLKPNEGKKGVIEVDGVQYLRLPIPTHLITDQDNICDVAQQYGAPLLQPGDVLFISEKCVACTQKPVSYTHLYEWALPVNFDVKFNARSMAELDKSCLLYTSRCV